VEQTPLCTTVVSWAQLTQGQAFRRTGRSGRVAKNPTRFAPQHGWPTQLISEFKPRTGTPASASNQGRNWHRALDYLVGC